MTFTIPNLGPFFSGILSFVGARLSEPSTWAGISALVTATQIPNNYQAIGTALGGLFAVLIKEKGAVTPTPPVT